MLGVNIFTNNQAAATTIAAEANIANPAGSGAGASVSVTINNLVDQFGTGRLPNNYAVSIAPSQACFWSVTNKTNAGFTVTLTPPSPGGVNATLAAGTFDFIVVG
jgi:hypothetical protein